LVAKGLDLEAHSASAIEVAAKGGNLGVLEYLLDRDTDLKGALQIAVLCQKPQAVETILKKRPNTNPDVVASLNQQGNSEQRIKEMSALALAVEQKDEEMVALILEHGRKSGPGEGLLESVRRNDSYFAEMILKATCRPSIQVWSEDGIVSALKSAQMATYLNNMSILQQILDAAEFLSYEKTRFVRAIVHGATSPTLALPEERRDRGWERTRRRRNKEPGEQQTMMSPSQRQQRLIDVLKLVEGRLTKPDEEEIACSILQAQLDDPETMLENLELFGSYISPHINSHRFRKSVRQAFESLLEQLQCNRAMQLVDRYPEHQSILREPQILQAALKYTPNGCCTLWWGLCEKHTKHLSKTLRSLIRAGAPLDGKDDEGHTPLYYACSMGWQVAFTLLVEAGADINVMQTLEVEDGPQSTQQDRHEDLTPELAITDLLHISLRRFLLCYNYQSLTFHQHWSSIIFYLLDAHMPCTLDDPGLSLLLESACRHGQIEEVKKLLYPDMWTHATPVPVERHFLNKSQGLCHAVRLGHMEIASMLLKHHVDPRVKQFDKQKNKEVSPIQACLADVNKAKGWEEVCDMLIDHGVSEEDAEAFLDHAVRAHQSERIRRLLDRGTRIPQLYGSVRPDTLTLLLDPKYRALVNFDGMLKELPSWIRWVKHQDDAIGRLEVVQKLSLVLPPIRGLVEGILQNHDIGEAGQIFLLDYLMLLYEHDVNASFPCKCGNPVTFLFEAISNNRAEVFQALLDQGADPNDPVLPYQGLILLCRRARFRQEKAAIKMASILLERGADINSTASKNDTSSEIHELTPLMYSVSHRDTKMVSWLIERGADVNRGFVAPLSLAFRVDFPQRQMIHLLLESGARSRQHDITKEYLLDPAIGLGPDNYWHHKYCHDCGLYKVYDM
jgi:ankyrin repeat protein